LEWTHWLVRQSEYNSLWCPYSSTNL